MEQRLEIPQQGCWKGEFIYSQESFSCSMTGKLLSVHAKNYNLLRELSSLSEIKTLELKSIPGFDARGKKKTFMCASKDVKDYILQASSFVVISLEPAPEVDKKNEKYRNLKQKLFELTTPQFPLCIAHLFPASSQVAAYIIPANAETKVVASDAKEELEEFCNLFSALHIALNKSDGSSPSSSFVRVIFAFKFPSTEPPPPPVIKVDPTPMVEVVEEKTSKVRVSNLDSSLSGDDIKKALEKEFGLYGTIKNIDIAYIPNKSHKKKSNAKVPVAYITFEDSQQAENAKKHLMGLMVGKRNISVQLYLQKNSANNRGRFQPY